MGNEMGNSSTSGFQEQENTKVESAQKSFEVPVVLTDAEHVEGENQPSSLVDGNDIHEKHTCFASEDTSVKGDPDVGIKTSDGTEQDKIETRLLNESANAPIAHNDSNNEEIETSSGHENCHEKHTNLEENPSGTSDHQIQKQIHISGADEERASVPSPEPESTSHDPKFKEPLDSKDSNQKEFSNTDNERIEVIYKLMQGGEEMPQLNVPQGNEKEQIVGTEVDNMQGISKYEEKLESSHEVDIVKDFYTITTTLSLSRDMETNGYTEQPPTNMDLIGNESLNLHSEPSPLTVSQDYIQQEVSHSEICLVPTGDTKLIGDGLGIDPNKNDPNQLSFSMESGEESKIHEISTSQSAITMVATDQEEKRKESELFDPCSSEKDFQLEQGNMPVNGSQVDLNDGNLSFISEKNCDDLEGDMKSVSKIHTDVAESAFMNGNHEGEELTVSSLLFLSTTEKKAVKEMMENTEDLVSIGNDTEAETEKQCLLKLHPIETSENLPPPYPLSSVQSQDSMQDTIIRSKTAENTDSSIMESDQDNISDLVVTNHSNVDSISLTADTISFSELKEESEKDQLVAFEVLHTSVACPEGQESICALTSNICDVESNSRSGAIEHVDTFYSVSILGNQTGGINITPHFDAESPVTSAEVSASSEQIRTLHKESSVKWEEYELSSCDSEAQVNGERFSMDSNPEKLNINVEVQEPASFDFELPSEARTEGSDQTPLLYQEKAMCKRLADQVDIKVENSVPEAKASAFKANKEESVQGQLQIPEMLVEKTVTLERTDTDNLRSPLLSFLKEQETYVLQTPQEQDALVATKKAMEPMVDSPVNEIKPDPHKSKAKRKHKPSLFSNCMCCTAVIH